MSEEGKYAYDMTEPTETNFEAFKTLLAASGSDPVKVLFEVREALNDGLGDSDPAVDVFYDHGLWSVQEPEPVVVSRNLPPYDNGGRIQHVQPVDRQAAINQLEKLNTAEVNELLDPQLTHDPLA